MFDVDVDVTGYTDKPSESNFSGLSDLPNFLGFWNFCAVHMLSWTETTLN